MHNPDLGRGMRWLLMACGPMNFAGAVCFAPPFPYARDMFGLSEPAPFYLWVLSAWIFAFGVAYLHQGWCGKSNRAILAIGAWGKAVFSVLLITSWMKGSLTPFAAAAAAPDLILAMVFGAWLWQSQRVS